MFHVQQYENRLTTDSPPTVNIENNIMTWTPPSQIKWLREQSSVSLQAKPSCSSHWRWGDSKESEGEEETDDKGRESRLQTIHLKLNLSCWFVLRERVDWQTYTYTETVALTTTFSGVIRDSTDGLFSSSCPPAAGAAGGAGTDTDFLYDSKEKQGYRAIECRKNRKWHPNISRRSRFLLVSSNEGLRCTCYWMNIVTPAAFLCRSSSGMGSFWELWPLFLSVGFLCSFSTEDTSSQVSGIHMFCVIICVPISNSNKCYIL